MITFQFSNLHTDVPSVNDWPDAILRVNADFGVAIDDVLVYQEKEFPVVEFAYQLHGWISCEPNRPFEYSSMESTENSILWFRPDAGVWTVGSYGSSADPQNRINHADLTRAARDFVVDLARQLNMRVGLDLLPVLLGPEDI